MRHKIVLSSFIFALLSPAPAALAQSECGLQAGTTPVICDQDSYTGGVTYDAVGDLFIDFTADPTTEIEAGGIDLTGDGSEGITFDSATTRTEIESRDTVGALLGVTTVDGDIDIQTEEIDADGQGASGVTHGIRAEATGSGSIFISNQVGNVDAAGGQNPADSIGIEALTTSGDITIAPVGVFDSTANGGGPGDILGNQYGIRAVSSGAGNVQINVTGRASNISGGERDIFAQSAGGDVGVEFLGETFSRSSTSIYASTENAGNILIRNTAESLTAPAAGSSPWQADIVTTVNGGSGTTLIDWGGDNASIDSLDATIGSGGLILNYGSDALGPAANTPGQPGRATAYVQDLTVTGPGDVAITLLDYSDQVNDPDVQATTRDLNEHRLLRGVHDFSGVGGDVTITLEANTYWRLGDGETSLFSPGDDVINIGEGAGVFTPIVWNLGGTYLNPPQDILAGADFGAGVNTVHNNGDIYVGPIVQQSGLNSGALVPVPGGFRIALDIIPASVVEGNRAELRLDSLDTFNNAGTIWLGATFIYADSRLFIVDTLGLDAWISGEGSNDILAGTDRGPDDILALPNAAFVGAEGSRIMMDANLGAVGQSECTAAARGANGALTNDCVNLRGLDASATGRTAVQITDALPGERGAYNPGGNVVVDLTDADLAAIDPAAFFIAPESDSYNPNIGNGAIDKGLFFYTLGFDPDLQQFRLYGLPGTGAQQFPLLATAANGLWDTATDGWFEQRADRRGQDIESGLGGGLWFRAAQDSADRDLVTPITGGGQTFEFDNGYQQDDTAVTFGLDLIDRNAGDSRWTAGGMLGYARSRVDFEDSGNNALMAGMHAGLYGSVTFGAFYVDAAYNQTWLDLDYDVPRMRLLPEDTELGADIESSGLRLEGGWRLAMGRFGVEPILGYSHVTTEVEDVNIPTDDPLGVGGTARYDDTTSQRGSAGVRLSLDNLWADVAPTTLTLTARAINEFDGESRVSIANAGTLDAATADEFDGTFTQVTGGLRMTNTAKTVSGYLNVDGTFESDYESLGLSAGFRYEW